MLSPLKNIKKKCGNLTLSSINTFSYLKFTSQITILDKNKKILVGTLQIFITDIYQKRFILETYFSTIHLSERCNMKK